MVLKRPIGYIGVLLITLIAILACETGIPPGEVAELYYNLGNAYFDLNEFDSAVNAYLNALALDSTLPQAGYNLARVYIESGKIDEGMEELNRLLEEDPENGILMSTLAWAHFLQGEYEAAYEVYVGITKRTPTDQNGLYNAAVLAWKLEKRTEALQFYERLYAESGENEVLYRVTSILMDMERWSDAIDQLLIYLNQNPSDGDAYFDLGLAYAAEQLYGDALDAFDNAIELKSDDPSILFEKAVVLLLFIENLEEGVKHLDLAVNAGFNDTNLVADLINAEELLFTEEVREFFASKNLLPEEPVGESATDTLDADEPLPPDSTPSELEPPASEGTAVDPQPSDENDKIEETPVDGNSGGS